MSQTRIKPIIALTILFGTLLWVVGVPAPAAPPVTVDEAIPNEGEQGASLTVRIKGKGFTNVASVRFLKSDGTDDPDIRVGTVTVVGSRDIDCDISIDAGAQLDANDIEVVLLSGRKGKGTEAFRVIQPGGGNELVMGVTMDDVKVNQSGDPVAGAAEVSVYYTNTSELGGAPTTTQAVVWVWAERCGLAPFGDRNIDLDRDMEPQYNCTREDSRSIEVSSDSGVPSSQTLVFSGLPSGDYIFFVDLNTNQSDNFAWKHGFAAGRVEE